MESEFWHQRWQQKEIGFHQEEWNPHLLTHWRRLGIPKNSRIFVPLCGKSHDMLWLVEQGYRVLGIELSEIAVREFFEGAGLEPEIVQQGDLLCFQTPHITIYCGDFFSLRTTEFSHVRGVYDRAALVALPEKMRQDYVTHLLNNLPEATKGLLVTMEYDEAVMQGPPFSVRATEVHNLFSGFTAIKELAAADIEFKGMQVRERIWEYQCRLALISSAIKPPGLSR